MLQIAIGRNVPTKLVGGESLPMLEEHWIDFQKKVEASVARNATGTVANTKAYGVSEWDGEPEDTCIFVWFAVESLPSVVYEELATIAKQYGQDAIAVTFGETKFVG